MNYLKISVIISILLFTVFACSSKKEADKEILMNDVEMYELGGSRLAEGRYDEAISTYEKLLTAFPTSDLHIDSQLKIAAAYGLMENFEEQMNIISRVLKENIINTRQSPLSTDQAILSACLDTSAALAGQDHHESRSQSGP